MRGLLLLWPCVVVRIADQLVVVVLRPLELVREVRLWPSLCLLTSCFVIVFFTLPGVAVDDAAVDVFALTDLLCSSLAKSS